VQELSGNLDGLSPAQKHMLERLWRRRVPPAQVTSYELAAFLCECSREIRRQVGVLVDRRGNVEHVIVGDHQKLFLPELGPRRAGVGRLRGVRLVHTHLRGEPLTRDDLLDLAKLRLDAVAAVQLRTDGQPGATQMAHLLPPNPANETWRVSELDLREQPDFLELMAALESEAAQKLRTVDAHGDRAVLVSLDTGRIAEGDAETRVTELRELCRTAGLRVLDVVVQKRAELDPRWLVGRGKIDEIVLRALQADATVLVFDRDLTPAQARSISDATDLKVIDRTMLILDIFALHAHSRDGKLQVELAQLKYVLPRLHEKNTMMSRLTGGIGGRGPGETKLEINRRRARDKIHRLEQQIAELGKRREGRRALRKKERLPVVSIVGYTNAGKSTLVNTLTNSDVLVADKLFATLDPTSRRLRFPDEREVIITDTVGFIRDLPADLVTAFRATLEELAEADVLVHVVDASDPGRLEQMRAVERILDELKLSSIPRVLVYNKIDRLQPAALRELVNEAQSERSSEPPVALSARDAESTRPLAETLERMLWREGAVTSYRAQELI
jgi:GTP-binding protein HflX